MALLLLNRLVLNNSIRVKVHVLEYRLYYLIDIYVTIHIPNATLVYIELSVSIY